MDENTVEFLVTMGVVFFAVLALFCGLAWVNLYPKKEAPVDRPPPITTRIKFPQGTVIVCPRCGEKIATAKLDIWTHDTISSYLWDGIAACSDMRCPKCRALYCRGDPVLQLHTDQGWL